MGAWWTYVIVAWLGAVVGWILCSVMTAAHRSDIATGDEPPGQLRVSATRTCEQESTSRVS
ncbi:MAG: hypothetical protein PVH68_12050 [Armatimonadota bacterium]